MNVAVNGERRQCPEGTTVADLLRLLDITHRGIAVAVNEQIVTRTRFDEHRLGADDAIEIIRAVAGG